MKKEEFLFGPGAEDLPDGEEAIRRAERLNPRNPLQRWRFIRPHIMRLPGRRDVVLRYMQQHQQYPVENVQELTEMIELDIHHLGILAVAAKDRFIIPPQRSFVHRPKGYAYPTIAMVTPYLKGAVEMHEHMPQGVAIAEGLNEYAEAVTCRGEERFMYDVFGPEQYSLVPGSPLPVLHDFEYRSMSVCNLDAYLRNAADWKMAAAVA